MGAAAIEKSATRAMLYPSAGIFVSFVAATIPPPPVTFSTTTGVPVSFSTAVATRRPSVSVAPPAPNAIIMVIGLSGYSADAGVIVTKDNNTAAAATASLFNIDFSSEKTFAFVVFDQCDWPVRRQSSLF